MSTLAFPLKQDTVTDESVKKMLKNRFLKAISTGTEVLKLGLCENISMVTQQF